MADDNRFGGRLRELREAAGMTQPQLAAAAGLSNGAISDLEQGRRRPAWETALALAAALDVSLDEMARAPAVRHGARLPGRPKKTPPADQAPPKRPRGRPRKEKKT